MDLSSMRRTTYMAPFAAALAVSCYSPAAPELAVGSVEQAAFTREDCSLYGFAKLTSHEEFRAGCMRDPNDPHGSGMALILSAYFNCKSRNSGDIQYSKYTWVQCQTGVTHPSEGEPSVSYGSACIQVNGVCEINQSSLPDLPLDIDGSTTEGQLLLALYDRIARLQEQVAREGGPNLEMRLGLLSASELFVDLADASYFNGDRIAALQAASTAQRVLDLGLDFVPGVSLAKDAITVATGKNPVTGERVSDVERAVLLAAMVTPAFVSGVTKGLVKTAATLEHVALSGRRGSHLAEELVSVIRRSDDELVELSKLAPCVPSFRAFGGGGLAAAARPCRVLGEVTAEIVETASKNLEFLRSGNTGFGTATRSDYTKTFRQYYASVSDQVGQVHHAVEQQVLERYPGVVTAAEINSLENLRGVEKGASGITLHQSTIRNEWNTFYRAADATGIPPTKAELLAFAKILDDKYGKMFIPPVR